MTNSSYQSKNPRARINLKLDLHTGGASKKTKLPLQLPVAANFSNDLEPAPLSESKNVNLNKNNFYSVLSEYSPKINLTAKNTLAGGESMVLERHDVGGGNASLFERITWTYKDGNIIHSDSWNERATA